MNRKQLYSCTRGRLFGTAAILCVALGLATSPLFADEPSVNDILSDLMEVSSRVRSQLVEVFAKDSTQVKAFDSVAETAGKQANHEKMIALGTSHRNALDQLSVAIWGKAADGNGRFPLIELPAETVDPGELNRQVNSLLDRAADVQKVLYRDATHVPRSEAVSK